MKFNIESMECNQDDGKCISKMRFITDAIFNGLSGPENVKVATVLAWDLEKEWTLEDLMKTINETVIELQDAVEVLETGEAKFIVTEE